MPEYSVSSSLQRGDIPEPEKRTCWRIRLPDGNSCSMIAAAGMTYQEAIEEARWRWPLAEVER